MAGLPENYMPWQNLISSGPNGDLIVGGVNETTHPSRHYLPHGHTPEPRPFMVAEPMPGAYAQPGGGLAMIVQALFQRPEYRRYLENFWLNQAGDRGTTRQTGRPIFRTE